MTQVLTAVSVLAFIGLLGWGCADQLLAWRNRTRLAERPESAADLPPLQRPIYKASAHDFLHGAADLTFGVVILGLGFFMLMWLIANG